VNLNALIWRKLITEVVHLGAIKMNIKGGKFLKQQILNMGKVKSKAIPVTGLGGL
jgi:hypothetical protein